MDDYSSFHIPVMPNETLELLAPSRGDVVVDTTIGAGGHAEKILEKILPDGKLIGIDTDEKAIEICSKRLAKYEKNVLFINSNFKDITSILESLQVFKIDKILFDLGVSSMQLNDPARGFSFMRDGALDMRMSQKNQNFSAFEIINTFSEEELKSLLYEYGEERFAKNIARAIVFTRQKYNIQTTQELAEIIRRSYPRHKNQKINPATRTFQALRIKVNDELGSLSDAIESSISFLSENGRIAVISFHSLEDRIIKNFFKQFEKAKLGKILTKKPITPDESEKITNPRARSAKLRGFQKIIFKPEEK